MLQCETLKIINMVYSVNEYRKLFKFGGKIRSGMTILRKINNNMLPSNHIPRKVKGKYGKGMWIIEVRE